jgi:spore maturation protein CgeB
MRLVVLGLSLTSSWGNGHATTYRALLRGMAARGHEVVFLERDCPWYAAHRDLPDPAFCRTHLYEEPADLDRHFATFVRSADAVILGSYVPEGIVVGDWVQATARGVTAFYDIDTPITLAQLEGGEESYLARRQIPDYDLYLSFAGGPTLARLEDDFGARAARALYCSVDEAAYRPLAVPRRWQLGYLGTYSLDRQPTVEALLLEPAAALPDQAFVVAGPQYPKDVAWPANVARIEHLPPAAHAEFYNSQSFTLNVTRRDMAEVGHAPSVRLFEAAACGVPIISDSWPGLGAFFTSGREILCAAETSDVVRWLGGLDEPARRAIGAAGRRRVLDAHTAAHRAHELETYLTAAAEQRRSAPTRRSG